MLAACATICPNANAENAHVHLQREYERFSPRTPRWSRGQSPLRGASSSCMAVQGFSPVSHFISCDMMAMLCALSARQPALGGGSKGGGGDGGGEGGGNGGGDGGCSGGGGEGGGRPGGGEGGTDGKGGDGGSRGGAGGGGVHSAESPAKSRLRPVGVERLLLTEKVASMYPSSGRKKI